MKMVVWVSWLRHSSLVVATSVVSHSVSFHGASFLILVIEVSFLAVIFRSVFFWEQPAINFPPSLALLFCISHGSFSISQFSEAALFSSSYGSFPFVLAFILDLSKPPYSMPRFWFSNVKLVPFPHLPIVRVTLFLFGPGKNVRFSRPYAFCTFCTTSSAQASARGSPRGKESMLSILPLCPLLPTLGLHRLH